MLRSQVRTRSLLSLVALSLAAASGCGDESGNFANVDLADIEIFPRQVSFNQIAIGETEVAQVTIENNGGSELIITEWSWLGAADDFIVEGLDELRVAASSSRVFTITYAPSDEAPDDADLRLRTNGGTAEVHVTSLGQAAVLRTNPVTVEMVADTVGLRVEETVQILNGGTLAFTIESLALLAPSAEFQMQANFDVPVTVGIEDVLTVTIAYNPSGRGADEASLVINHDAANAVEGRSSVPVIGSVRSPFILSDPEFIAFGAVPIDETVFETAQIINNGETTLRISDLYMNFGSSDDIALVSFDGVPFEDGAFAPVEIGSGESAELEVAYTPSDNTPDNASAIFANNDPDFPLFELPMGGRLAAPYLTVTPEVLSFGSVANSLTVRRGVVIRNAGTEPMTVDPVTFDGGNGSFSVFNGNLLPATLGPDEGLELLVEFSPQLEGNLDATMTVTSADDPWHSPVTVFLNGFGAGAPVCTITVSPATVDFGLVPRGSSATGRAAVRNAGSGTCRINQVRLSPPPFGGIGPFGDLFSDAFHLVSVSIPNGTVIGPGDTFFVEAQYAPIAFTVFSEDDLIGDTSSIEIDVTDPADTGRTITCGSTSLFSFAGFGRDCGINLRARSGIAEIAAIPGEVDFGLVTRGCNSQEITINVYNIGSAPVTLSAVRLEACTPEFRLTGVPPEVSAGGLEIPSGAAPVPLRVRYAPTNLGQSTCQLVIESDAETAARLVVPLQGTGTDTSAQTDHFEQISGRKVDVLFVVDNSGSMSEEQTNLASNFASFIAAAQTWGNDFQLGVVTTEADESFAGRNPGELVGSPRLLYSGMANLAAEFSDNARVGDGGDGARESGLEAAWLALTDPLASDIGACGGDCAAPYACVANARGTESRCGGYNRSFLREDASLELVFVSDEEDQSRGTIAFYIDFFRSLKGAANTALFHASAIVGPRGTCSTADAGNRYLDVAQATDGVSGSICDTNFAASLTAIGNRAFGLRVSFFLSRVAVPESVVVTRGGAAMTGWTYDAASNAVVFTEATAPSPGTSFDVSYTARCF